MSKLTASPEWKALEAHAAAVKNVHMRDLFAADAQRAAKFSSEACGIFLDYSKNRITDETMAQLQKLLASVGFAEMRAKFFKGDKINHTEKRAVLHTALRYQGKEAILVDGKDVMPDVRAMPQRRRAVSSIVPVEKQRLVGRPDTFCATTVSTSQGLVTST